MSINNVPSIKSGYNITHLDDKISKSKLGGELAKIINGSSNFSKAEKKSVIKIIDGEKELYNIFRKYKEIPGSGIDSSAPASHRNLISNLNLLINNYPNMLLGNDLAVYHKKDLPDNTDVNVVFDKLKSEKERIMNSLETGSDNSMQIAALMEINAALDIYVPKKTVPITFHLQNTINKDSNDVFLDAIKEGVKDDFPIILTKTIIYNQVAAFESVLKDKDVYVQKNGSFVLVLPKGAEPKSLGFNIKNFEKWEKPFSEIPAVPLSFSSDLNHLFLKDQENMRFERIISLQGHGVPPNQELGQVKGEVSGLPMDAFHEGLGVLKDNNMVFLHLFTCFGGGENSTQLHGIGGEVPCPILVESSLELPAFGSKEGYGKLFSKVDDLLFKNSESVKEPRTLHQLSQTNLSQIAKLTPMSQTKDMNAYMFCLSMALLPTSLSDVPKVGYVQPTLEGIIDIHGELKKQHIRTDSTSVLNVPSEQSTMLLSSPVIDSKIVIEGPKLTLISRGGTSQHLIRELEAPNVDIEQIAKATFEIGLGLSSPAKKAYYFGKVTCKYNGELKELENCMFKKTDTECYLLFKVKGEDGFTYVNYVEEKNAAVPKNKTSKLSSKEAELLVYDTLRETQASKGNLEQIGVTPFDSRKDILNSFPALFWHNESLIENRADLDQYLTKLESEIEQAFANSSNEEIIELLERSPVFFRYLDKKWRSDVSIITKVVPTYPSALEFVDNDTLKEVIKVLPSRKGFLKYCSSEARGNEEIVALFLKHNLFGNIDACGKSAKNNSNLMLIAVSKYAGIFPFIGEDLKNDDEFLMKCVEVAPSVFKHMSEKARSNPLIVEKALAKDSNLKKYVRDNYS